jgi:hypothetical protein
MARFGLQAGCSAPIDVPASLRRIEMNNIVYLVGLVVIVLLILSFFGFR